MSIISNMETAILGLICEKPMHGYEIEKTIEERNMRYWTEISLPSIYKVLTKLEKKSLITSEIKLSKNNIAQKIYTITPQGQQTLKSSLIEILSNVEKTIWRVDLAVANLCFLSKQEVQTSLQKYIASIDESIAIYRQVEAFFQQRNYPPSDYALALRPIMHLKAEKEWATNFMETVTKNE
ncbi:MAG: PadR family transcriptional regulator [Candidatus Bathyarchaeota archaeon]|nr:PadR family transcriptional regulator [Candidatus Bathyarchaeota archaeon]